MGREPAEAADRLVAASAEPLGQKSASGNQWAADADFLMFISREQWDRSIDCYMPIDLQNYVNELQYVPLEISREGPNTEELRQMGIHAAIAKNKAESCYEPLALKTIREG